MNLRKNKSEIPVYKATIQCNIDSCNWKTVHDNSIDGAPNWSNYAQLLRDHNILRHENFEIIDNFEEITIAKKEKK